MLARLPFFVEFAKLFGNYLVKSYKLVTDSLSDPAADARLAASVLGDQWAAFKKLVDSGNMDLLRFYRFSFTAGSDRTSLEGLADVFASLGSVRVLEIVRRRKPEETKAFQGLCRVESWEFPWIEVVYQAGT